MAATGYTKGDPQKVARSGDTMTGELVLPDSSPDSALTAASRGYVDNASVASSAAAATYADNVSAAASGAAVTASNTYTDNTVNALSGTYVDTSGDTMTGALNLQYGNISSDVGHDLSMSISTGVMHTGGPITQASSTSVSVPAGLAMFVDPSHNHPDPLLKTVAFGPETVELDDPTDPLTYFMVDVDGNIVQNDGVPTRSQRRTYAILGRAVVLGGSIANVEDSPVLNSQPRATTLDLLQALGGVRVDGIRAAPIASGLTFSLTAGGIFNLGANFSSDPTDPNVSPFNAVSPAQFRYVTQNSVDATLRTAIVPGMYDMGGTVTAVPGGANVTTIQRVHCFPTQNVFIQYGQNTYSTLAAALDALAVGDIPGYVTHPDLIGGGVRTAFIVCTRTATNLADTGTSRVVRATQFGNPGGL